MVNGVSDALLTQIATAFATAEGYYVSGSRAQRNNNPGDITKDITGTGIGFDGPFVIYATPDDGFAALKHQISLMFGGSTIYTPDMSIIQIAGHYTTTEVDSWADTVAETLGVSVNTTLNQLKG